MDEQQKFIIEHLDKKSTAILGFVILQSIFLAEKLSDETFISKVLSIYGLHQFILVVHSVIVIFSIAFLFKIDRKISEQMDKTLKDAFQPHITLGVKMVLTAIFGTIPVMILLHELLN